jgi:hypothetical protein
VIVRVASTPQTGTASSLTRASLIINLNMSQVLGNDDNADALVKHVQWRWSRQQTIHLQDDPPQINIDDTKAAAGTAPLQAEPPGIHVALISTTQTINTHPTVIV